MTRDSVRPYIVLAGGVFFLLLGIFSSSDATWSRIVQVGAGLVLVFLAIRELRGGPPA